VHQTLQQLAALHSAMTHGSFTSRTQRTEATKGSGVGAPIPHKYCVCIKLLSDGLRSCIHVLLMEGHLFMQSAREGFLLLLNSTIKPAGFFHRWAQKHLIEVPVQQLLLYVHMYIMYVHMYIHDVHMYIHYVHMYIHDVHMYIHYVHMYIHDVHMYMHTTHHALA